MVRSAAPVEDAAPSVPSTSPAVPPKSDLPSSAFACFRVGVLRPGQRTPRRMAS